MPEVVEWGCLGMLHVGSSGHNMENLIMLCWERYHVPYMLKNPTVVFSRSRNHRALPQEVELSDPTTSPNFQWQSKFVNPIILVSHPIFHFIIISCSSSEYSRYIAARVLNPNNQSTNQSIFNLKESLLVEFQWRKINENLDLRLFSKTVPRRLMLHC